LRELGIVACGHPNTAAAAEEILLEGGNAFDAIVAAHFASCVVEPVLASLGGGGYLLAHARQQPPRVYDFFNQTPRHKRPAEELDFYPVHVDFGGARQEFHIGLGAAATPGAIRGMFLIHRDLCTLPMQRLLEPAIHYAREGVVFPHYQAYIFSLVAPIYTATPEARAVYTGQNNSSDSGLIAAGQRWAQPQLADTLQGLAEEGEALFYEGELAQRLVQQCRQGGGHLQLDDLRHYQAMVRESLSLQYRQGRLYTNPPPSSGGILMAFALGLLSGVGLADLPWHSEAHLRCLAEVMALTNKARLDAHFSATDSGVAQLLDGHWLELYRQQLLQRSACFRGTTHLSVMDSQGNSAAMTVSNGEGCGCLLTDTGIMLNNVLGEEDINPDGFHGWQPDQRMTSMMAPSLIETPDGWTALGSGGSNRIRTALLQVISNLLDYHLSPEEAVARPRIHLENDQLDIEGIGEQFVESAEPQESDPLASVQALLADYPQHKLWQKRNLFFGGVHLVECLQGQFSGAGDPRRGGVAKIVSGN